MRIEVEGVVYEGTPEELREFFPNLAGRILPEVATDPTRADSTLNIKKVIREVLHRLPVPRGQQELYKALYHSGDKGLSYSQIAEVMNRTEQEIAGVLGALGRRVNGTPGVSGDEGIGLLFIIERVGDEWHYRMKPELRQVLEEEGFDWLQ